ncbi:response regulator, partial [Massilia arenosa]
MTQPGSLSTPVSHYDWSASMLGAPAGWPFPLRLAADLVLGAPVPALLVWGSDRVVILNAAYETLAASRSARAPGG